MTSLPAAARRTAAAHPAQIDRRHAAISAANCDSAATDDPPTSLPASGDVTSGKSSRSSRRYGPPFALPGIEISVANSDTGSDVTQSRKSRCRTSRPTGSDVKREPEVTSHTKRKRKPKVTSCRNRK